ncbi:pikAI, partial [Symbiodinium sp. CCMP2456]
ARYLFREMWLWTERDLTLYAVVSLFLVEVYVVLISPGQRQGKQVVVTGVMWTKSLVWAFLLLVLSIVGMVGTNLVWAVGSIRPSIPQKVALMICQSLANQGSIFRWSRDQRCHLKNKGTDADPFDPQRGLAYRYIGWSLMHKTPKMIEATRSVDVHDLLLDQVVMFQADVDAWWNLSFSHAIPAFATLLWGEELFLGWVIAGCARSVLALHINLILLCFQHLWCPQKVMVSAADAEEEEAGDRAVTALQLSSWLCRLDGEEDFYAPGKATSDAPAWVLVERFRRSPSRPAGRALSISQHFCVRSEPFNGSPIASIADVGLAMEQDTNFKMPSFLLVHSTSFWTLLRSAPLQVHESSTGADPSVEVKLEPLWRRSTLVDLAKDAVADILQVQATAVKPDRPLMDLGFDSAGLEFARDMLFARLGVFFWRLKIELPPTLLFDHPTINVDMVDNGIALLSKRPMTPAHADGVIVSTSCQFPGGASSLKLYWDMLADKKDAVIEVPLSRWDHELYYSQEPQEGKTYARHGGFVEGTDLFDVTYFGLGSAEARTTDPQQRMLLGAAYDALRGDGYDKALLQNNPLGVFTALSNMEWFHLAVSKPGVYTGPGVSSAIAANRISYVFGLKGPSMTASASLHFEVTRDSQRTVKPDQHVSLTEIDTACSSSLSALHAALRSLEVSAMFKERLATQGKVVGRLCGTPQSYAFT